MRRDPLRFYPRAWRERYGDEVRAMIEDDLAGRDPGRSYRARLAASGLRERARQSGLAGDAPATSRRRAGSLVVLYAWVALCAAGGSFAKASEHYRAALAPAQRAEPMLAYHLVVGGAVAGALLVALGALVALPDLLAARRSGRARGVGRAAAVALAVSVGVVAATVALALWAHHLDPAQRNGADWLYSAAFVAWALAGVATLGLWARAAGRAASITLGVRALAIESWLAVAAAAAAALVAAAGTWWWALMAARAPGFLAPSPGASVVTVQLVGTLGLMALCVAAAGYGVARIARARR